MKNTKLLFWSILYFFKYSDGLIQNSLGKYSSPKYKTTERATQITKVTLTQVGYIQFLKYINEVPPLTEYTFCIWLRSNNLTHNHPILSYSKNEEERLIRVWLGPYGKDINLEILGNHIFDFPINVVENKWNHICQSWSSHQGIWMLYLNGKFKSSGSFPKLRGNLIKGGGDIVVGQEYTDFDKGLDDGIEGDISGFNFVLSSTSGSLKFPQNSPFRRKFHIPRYPQVFNPHPPPNITPIPPQTEEYKTIVEEDNTIPDPQNFGIIEPTRTSKGLLDLFRNLFADQPQTKVRVVQKYPPNNYKFTNRRSSERFGPNEIGDTKKSLGQILVELSFDCGYRKGAPVSGKNVLINWNQSPVRVFGGAILKTIPAFCYDKQLH